ncbi:MAG TPA: dUTP diphosphatase [Thermoanaerobaculia bacterium]|nr:dUTP diphosphatase [Thermoanaerobaculia bacterium]
MTVSNERTAAPLRVSVRRLSHAAGLPFPSPASSGSAGLDLRAALTAPLEIRPMQRLLVPTGLVIGIPAGYEGQVRPRSGWAWREGLTILNAPGTIDSDFRGELQVLLVHLGERLVTIERGDRIAQLVIAPMVRIEWEERDPEGSERGSGGFGSTGR